jgi:hypothetical protein
MAADSLSEANLENEGRRNDASKSAIRQSGPGQHSKCENESRRSDQMNRRKFVGLFGGASAALSTPNTILELLAEPANNASLSEDKPGADDGQGKANYFPAESYTPFGYLDNPNHSSVFNRSGVLRSVPPLGFGYWARKMPFPYGLGALREVNYLSFLHLSFVIDGVCFHSIEDFRTNGVQLESRYHTKNVMSYDWTFRDMNTRIQFLYTSESRKDSTTQVQLQCKDSIIAVVELKNRSASARAVTAHATNIYGFPEQEWWGSDGVTASLDEKTGTALSKIWAYGDVFGLSADRKSNACKATCDEKSWIEWIRNNDLSSNQGTNSPFPGAIYTVQSYAIALPSGGETRTTIGLSRSVNRDAALHESSRSISSAKPTLGLRLAEDSRFYAKTPVLTGDWAPHWKHGWIYDIETLRMTIRPALGIYKHPWDGMQIFTPRAVLGETLLDSLTMSYCDIELAKSVILGLFADAQAPNLPCSREDGSVNMICADGSEVGTAPTWGMPFPVIRSIYLRDGDAEWIRALYPHMAAFLDWWLSNRTDQDGWFHCKCSWESGQDGSKRFIVAEGNPAAVSDFVRTADIEAAMADAFRSMVLFSEVADRRGDRDRWKKLSDHRIETTRSMCVDGWFRDFDARTNKPIILRDYYDVMMLYPVAAEIATEEQMKAIAPRFQYFADHATFWLEWPSFMMPFSEAAWNSKQRQLLATVLYRTAERVYSRTDSRQTRPIPIDESWPEDAKKIMRDFPTQYRHRIPGVANEFWPVDESNPGGCENYGWGATLPALIIRNMLGFREFPDPGRMEFQLVPTFPAEMMQEGRTYGISNLSFRRSQHDVEYRVEKDQSIHIKIISRSESSRFPVRVKDEGERTLAMFERNGNRAICQTSVKPGSACIVAFA